MKYAIFGILLLLTLTGLTGCASPKVQRGDSVLVTYTGKYTNGTIFDTNDKQYLEQFPNKQFTPLSVKVGAGQVIVGFDNALVDMKKGESKTVTIKAKDAYGGIDSSKVISVPKFLSAPIDGSVLRDISVPISSLPEHLRNSSSVGSNVSTKNFVYKIESFNSTDAKLYLLTPSQKVVQLEQLPWNSTIVSVTKDSLTFKHNVVDGELVTLPQGEYVASTNSTTINLHTTVKLGNQYQRGYEMGIASSETDNSIKIDFNHPLAGYDLVFDIKVDELVPKK